MKNFVSTGLKVDKQGIWILDQTRLPHDEIWLHSPNPETMIAYIRELKVRGAPLIGVAAALQLGWLVESGTDMSGFEKALWALREARPTAVNLMNAMDRLLKVAKSDGLQAVTAAAEHICDEDVKLAGKMAGHGASLIKDGDRILTHCNTGGLATVGIGTALGCIIEAHKQGKKFHVYVDETRPLLQGGRLTTWELKRNGVPFTLLCDNAAAFLMQKGLVDKVMLGADRIARNGDFANKVGTCGLATLCKFHGLAFYVVAPQTTVDLNCPNGEAIPIEERSADEVRGKTSLATAPVWNPAFDVTPECLVTGWVMDSGVFDRDDVKRGALCGQ